MTSYLDQTYNNMDVAELFRCCRSGDIEKLRYLIDVKDVELNVRDFWDSTPLYYACLCGHEDMVELLLKSGSRCEANTFDGERCLYGALTDEIEEFWKSIMQCFEQGAFADVHFVVQEDTVPAHRVILSARSLYLAEMFNTKWKEDTVFLPKTINFSSGQFRNMLKYFYTGKLDVPFQECDAYLYLASLFQLDELKKLIETRVENAKTFGESKRGFVRVTMICIDPSMERRNLKEEFTKLAEVALPDPFRFQQLPEMSLFISQMLGDNENALDDLSTLSDVCFHVEDFEFHCNKVFFYHRSHYFKALFDFSNTATAADQRRNLTGNYSINIRDLTPDIFAVVVAYMYTDDAKIPSDFEGIFNVICAAEMYLLPGLKRLCINSMIEILDVTNVVQAVRVSRTFSSPRLEAECCCYIAEYMDELANDQSLIELILEDARGIEERQETDSIPLVDDIRSHLYSSLLPNYSSENPTSSSEQRLEALEHMLRNIGLEC